ncbi:Bug family tripartite tricarboxylate transporter substrate binding protein [Natronococcus amylolyticus]|uniref:Bug family tripartite tricarboxylate transporter substrate binding protein n=1 Tax=Natronococcus amylolyticus TaxID=44470 RepID=UPI001268A18E|nr:tripartite tricarboxylate transporter substrate-binding protein [Natronococcus amylolyticus]
MGKDNRDRGIGRRSFVKCAGAASAVSLAGLAGCLTDDEGDGGDDYPSDDIQFIIPFSEGGGTDVYAREMGPMLGEELGVNLPIENISGAASLRGTGEMMHSEPDGYTVAAYNPPSTPVSEMVNEQDFDLTEATGLGLFATTPFVIVAHPDYEIEDYDDLIDRYDDGELEIFSGKERGGIDHVMAKVMREEHGINWEEYVGYDGSGPAVEATMSDEVPAAISTDTAAEAAVADDSVDLVCVLASGGSGVFPDEEPVTEQGYEEMDYLVELSRGIYAPPETPDEVVEAWEDALETVMTSEEMEEWSEETGNEIIYDDGAAAEAVVEEAYEQIPDVVDLDDVRDAAD